MKTYDITYNDENYAAVVRAVSYIHPFEDINKISDELKENVPEGSSILFDLLLCNGDEINRFFESISDKNGMVMKDLRRVELPAESVALLNKYYHGRVKELSNSILTKRQQAKFAMC